MMLAPAHTDPLHGPSTTPAYGMVTACSLQVRLNINTQTRTIEHATLLTHPQAKAAPDADRILEEIFQFWDNVRARMLVGHAATSRPYARARAHTHANRT